MVGGIWGMFLTSHKSCQKINQNPVRRKANVGLLDLPLSTSLATTKAHRLGATNGMAEQFATCLGLPGAAESPQMIYPLELKVFRI